MSKTALPEMPRYSQDFSMDFTPGSVGDGQYILYLLYVRYYSAWNPDGSREPVSAGQVYWPDITVTDPDGVPSVVSMNVTDDNLKLFSHYTTVKAYTYGPLADGSQMSLNIQGFFEQAGYMSLALYRYIYFLDGTYVLDSETHYRGDELTPVDGGLNPFIKGNLSVFAYERPTPVPILFSKNTLNVNNLLKKNIGSVAGESNRSINTVPNLGVDEHIDFYRPSKQSFHNDEYGAQESLAPDGCSPDYLGALNLLDSEKNYFILKMKMPTTFIHGDNPDLTYAGYEVQELTIDTYNNLGTSATRYAVSSRLLNDYMDNEGYVYVFLAPEDVVTQLATDQGLDYNVTKIPPIYTWNGKIGYVLDRGIMVIRHRGSDPTWEGYVGNTTCYLTDADLQPVQPADLGEYYPELTGVDSLPGLGGAK